MSSPEDAQAIASQAMECANSVAFQIVGVTIKTPEQAQWATDLAHQMRDMKRALEAERDSAIGPIKGTIKKITGWFKPAIEKYESLELHLKMGIMAHRQALQEQQTKALSAATSQVEIAQAVAVLAPKPLGLQEREVKRVVVTNESEIPREYLVPDMRKIEQALRDGKVVPGTELVIEKVAVLR